MKHFFWTFLLIIAFACGSNDRPPEGVMSEKKMISFLKEAYYAETKVKNLHLSSDSSRLLFRNYELALYQKYGVTEEQFAESYNYYLQNPYQLEDINAAILDSLGVMDALLEKKGPGLPGADEEAAEKPGASEDADLKRKEKIKAGEEVKEAPEEPAEEEGEGQ